MTAAYVVTGCVIIAGFWVMVIAFWPWIAPALSWLLRALWRFGCRMCRHPERWAAAEHRKRQEAAGSRHGPRQKAAMRSQPSGLSDDEEARWRVLATQLDDIPEQRDGGDR